MFCAPSPATVDPTHRAAADAASAGLQLVKRMMRAPTLASEAMDGIEIILSVMGAHDDAIFVQKSACDVVSGVGNAGAARIAESGGVELIAAAMRKHGSSLGTKGFNSFAFGLSVDAVADSYLKLGGSALTVL